MENNTQAVQWQNKVTGKILTEKETAYSAFITIFCCVLDVHMSTHPHGPECSLHDYVHNNCCGQCRCFNHACDVNRWLVCLICLVNVYISKKTAGLYTFFWVHVLPNEKIQQHAKKFWSTVKSSSITWFINKQLHNIFLLCVPVFVLSQTSINL